MRKITLRNKTNPEIVLPEGEMVARNTYREGWWTIRWSEEGVHSFSGNFWEEVPPPFTFPTNRHATISAYSKALKRRVLLTLIGEWWVTSGPTVHQDPDEFYEHYSDPAYVWMGYVGRLDQNDG